jgi:hypothetical protein
MISKDAGAAVALASGIRNCKQYDEDFWLNVVTRIITDLDEAGHASAVGYVAGLLGGLWDQLPYVPGLRDDIVRQAWSLEQERT